MAGKVLNITDCSPLELDSSLIGKVSRNLPLLIQFTVAHNSGNHSDGIDLETEMWIFR